MAGSDRKKTADGGRKNKASQASRQDVATRQRGDVAARPKTKHDVAKAHKPGHQPDQPDGGEQARVGRHARKPSDTRYREGQQDSISSLTRNEKADTVHRNRAGTSGVATKQ